MPRVIPYESQSINDDISAVIDVLRSPFLTQGNIISEFEAGLRERFDSVYSVLMNSAASALHAAYLVLGIEKGDFSIAENYAKRATGVPIFPALTETLKMKVINKIKKRLTVK